MGYIFLARRYESGSMFHKAFSDDKIALISDDTIAHISDDKIAQEKLGQQWGIQ